MHKLGKYSEKNMRGLGFFAFLLCALLALTRAADDLEKVTDKVFFDIEIGGMTGIFAENRQPHVTAKRNPCN